MTQTDDRSPRQWPYAALLLLVVAVISITLAWAARSRPLGNDESLWFYAARIWVDHGAPPYVGSVENKTPGIFVVCAAIYRWFGMSEGALRWVGGFHVVVAAMLVARIARRLHDGTAGLAAALLVGLAAAGQALGGAYTAMTESFVMAWGALALLLVLEGEDGSPRRAAAFSLLAGVALGVAVGFKQIAIVGAGTVASWIWLRGAGAAPRVRLARIALAAAGTVAGTLLVALPVLADVSFADYVDGAWGILLDPGTRPRDDGFRTRLANLAGSWNQPMPVLVAGAVACGLVRTRLAGARASWACLVAWMVFDGLGAHASGRYYGHHWKQWVPSLAAAAGIALAAASGAIAAGPAASPGTTASVRRALGVLLVAALLVFPWRVGADTAGDRVRRGWARDRQFAAWIASRTAPDDRVVLVAPDMSTVLALSGRRSATRWFNTFFLGRPGARHEIAAEFRERPPKLVVFSPRHTRPEHTRFYESLLGDRYGPPEDVFGCRAFLRR